MVDAPGVDPPKTGTPRPPEEGGAASPVKKRRGRPRKCDTIAAAAAASPQLGTNGGVTPTPARKIRKRKIDPLSPPRVDASLVGQSVHGVLDGSFDAGYILTVRVGETDTILRGVVFGPGLCVPITTANDIAPNVRFAGGSRGGAGGATATARLSSPVPASSTTPSSSQAVVMPPALAENPLDVSSSRHHTPVRDHGQQLGFAPVVPPLFGVQTPTAGFIEAGKSCLVEQQQQQPRCSLQLANGSSPQREQQQRTLAEASIEDTDRA